MVSVAGVSVHLKPVVSGDGGRVPVSRCKQGAVLLGNHVYLLGGRNGNLALKDFWRYHIGKSRLGWIS